MDVRAGDVLLYRGHGFVSRAIRFLDGGEVNHAAIALSRVDQAEATAHGLDVSLIARAAEGAQSVIVLRSDQVDAGATVARARAHLDDGVPYAYQQILLLAGLCLTRRIPIGDALFRRALRRILEAGAELLNSMLDRGTDLMICSEYVYRCYHEAGLDLVPEPAERAASGATLESAPAGPGSPIPDGVVLLEWLGTRPLPESAATPVGTDLPGETTTAPGALGPAAIAEIAEFEIDDLLARYFVAAEGSAVGPSDPVLEVETILPDVTDDEILAAAAALGDAALRAQGAAASTVLESAADPVSALRAVFATNANFVTPRDLHVSPLLTEVGRLP